jgi:hypothetical protein
MRQKKGILMKNALEVVIVVLGLAIIAFGIWKLYSVYVDAEAEDAKNTISVIMDRIDAIESGQKGKITIRGVDGWALVGFSEGDSAKPENCYFTSCICICKLSGNDFSGITPNFKIAEVSGSAIDKCGKKGFCRAFEEKVIKLHRRSTVESTVYGNYIREDSFIILPKNLIEIDVIKSENSVEIFHNNPNIVEGWLTKN